MSEGATGPAVRGDLVVGGQRPPLHESCQNALLHQILHHTLGCPEDTGMCAGAGVPVNDLDSKRRMKLAHCTQKKVLCCIIGLEQTGAEET